MCLDSLWVMSSKSKLDFLSLTCQACLNEVCHGMSFMFRGLCAQPPRLSTVAKELMTLPPCSLGGSAALEKILSLSISALFPSFQGLHPGGAFACSGNETRWKRRSAIRQMAHTFHFREPECICLPGCAHMLSSFCFVQAVGTSVKWLPRMSACTFFSRGKQSLVLHHFVK